MRLCFGRGSRGDTRVGRGVQWKPGGRGGKVAGSEAGGRSRARLTPVADPFMLRRAKTVKRK